MQDAVLRAATAWNKSQLTDALRSVRFFLDAAESAMTNNQTKG